jgi:hypothetical protein
MTHHELRKAVARRRWAPYVEAIILAAIIMGVNLGIQALAPQFEGWMFIPYLAIVLVVAGRFGLAAGAFALCVSLIGFRMVFVWAHQALPELLILRSPMYGLVASFALGAFLIGAGSDRARGRLRQAMADYDRLRRRHERLMRFYGRLSADRQLLSQQVHAHEQTLPTVTYLYSQLEGDDAGEICQRLFGITRRLMAGGTAALYSCTPAGALQLQVSDGDPVWPENIRSGDPVVELAHSRGNLVTIADVPAAELDSVPEHPIQLAAPLSIEGTSEPVVLVVQGLPVAAFVPARLQSLAVALDVAARSLARTGGEPVEAPEMVYRHRVSA